MKKRDATPKRPIAGNQPPTNDTVRISLDPQRANRGTLRGAKLLQASLEAHGAGRSILVDRHGSIIAGNQTFTAAQALGLHLRVVPTAGDELVVVQRTNLDLTTDATARQLALADNRISELNLDWDPDRLAAFAKQGIDLSSFWTPQEFERLVGSGARTGATEPDSVVPIAATTIEEGQIFQLGAHRVACGDATDPGLVNRLMDGATPSIMVTDPPYSVAYAPEWRAAAGRPGRHAVGRVQNDDRADWGAAFALFPGTVAYVWHAGLHAGVVKESLAASGFDVRAQIVWVKPHFVLGRGDYHWQHEPCWYAVRRGETSQWTGDRAQSTVWSVPNLNPFSGGHDAENPETGHSTQKPVGLFERALLNNSASGATMYDPFLGSGTALIAAEKTGRGCLGVELDPRYVQVAITRWEAYSGLRAAPIEAAGAGR